MLLKLSIHLVALDSQIPIHLMAVKVGAINAGELGLAANGQTAAAAHTGTVHHDGAHGNGGGHAVGLGGQGHKLHHDHGADGEDLVILIAGVQQLLQSLGDQTLLAVGTVVSADLQHGGDSLELLFQNDNILVLEDAAHGFGGEYKGKKLGTIGHFGAYSFHEVKNMTSFGEGGIVYTQAFLLEYEDAPVDTTEEEKFRDFWEIASFIPDNLVRFLGSLDIFRIIWEALNG